jgi:hypothetical protein
MSASCRKRICGWRLSKSAIAGRADIAGLGADLYSGLDQRPTCKDVRGFYPVTMMREPSMIMLMVLSAVLATPAAAQTGNILSDNYSIMVPEKGSKQKQKVSKREQPEPWLAPKYRSPSGTVQQVHIPKSKIVNPPSATDPGYVYVPQTGRTFQNLPTPGRGTETSQDRAMRCAHQAGVYGQTGNARGSYMGSCL